MLDAMAPILTRIASYNVQNMFDRPRVLNGPRVAYR